MSLPFSAAEIQRPIYQAQPQWEGVLTLWHWSSNLVVRCNQPVKFLRNLKNTAAWLPPPETDLIDMGCELDIRMFKSVSCDSNTYQSLRTTHLQNETAPRFIFLGRKNCFICLFSNIIFLKTISIAGAVSQLFLDFKFKAGSRSSLEFDHYYGIFYL